MAKGLNGGDDVHRVQHGCQGRRKADGSSQPDDSEIFKIHTKLARFDVGFAASVKRKPMLEQKNGELEEVLFDDVTEGLFKVEGTVVDGQSGAGR